MKKPKLFPFDEINGFIIEISIPALERNGFYRGAKFNISKNGKSLEFTVNTTFPVNYDDQNGYNGIDQSDEISLNKSLDKLIELLEQQENGITKELEKQIEKALQYVT